MVFHLHRRSDRTQSNKKLSKIKPLFWRLKWDRNELRETICSGVMIFQSWRGGVRALPESLTRVWYRSLPPPFIWCARIYHNGCEGGDETLFRGGFLGNVGLFARFCSFFSSIIFKSVQASIRKFSAPSLPKQLSLGNVYRQIKLFTSNYNSWAYDR